CTPATASANPRPAVSQSRGSSATGRCGQRASAWFQGSGPGSVPAAATARRGGGGVPPGGGGGGRGGGGGPGGAPAGGAGAGGGAWMGVRVNSTSVAPGGRSVLPATPQLTTTRRGGSTSR